jgi:uncharacterized tellurite resistance protein B-like protein
MTLDPQVKNLVKILIGSAWLDGQIQPEEREYLHRIVQEQGVATDPEIQPLLYEFRPVKPEECYRWVQEFLGENPTSEQCQQLIEAISGLIYSDGTVATEEAKLLTDLQLRDPHSESAASSHHSVMTAIRNLYQRWVSKFDE